MGDRGRQASIEQTTDWIARAERLAALTGAGISKESGIPTFRDALDGLWARYDPEQLATPSAFGRNPDLVWRWYMYRRNLVRQAEPNPGHLALADLEGLLPHVTVLTQNVDNMHRRAGSSDVVELHGNLTRFKCSADCRGTSTVIDLETIDHNEEVAPPCPYCGAHIRPDVVWYGEALPHDVLQRALAVSERCQVMLVVGTSGVVQPAASLPSVAKRHGAMVIDVNPEPSGITPIADIFLQGLSGEVLPLLVAAIRERLSG
jgi:NAD-dependent deacetylase